MFIVVFFYFAICFGRRGRVSRTIMSDNGPARYLYTPLKAIGSMLPLWTGSKKQTAVSNRIEPLSTTASVLRPRLICATGSDTEGPASLLGKQDSNEGGDDDSQMSDSDEFVDCDPLPQSLLAINGRIPEDSRKNGCEQSQADASRVIDLPASSNPSKIPSQVRVFLRCKPSIGPKFLKVVTSNEVLFRQKTQTICGAGERVRQKQYFFSRVFEESVDQEEVFVEVALPVVERVFTEHTDELILAFGPSGSGKTYSLGCDGILGRALASILRKADGLLSKVDVTPHGWSGTTAGAVQHTKEVCNQPICTYSVWISFVECYDLLDDCSQNSARRAHKFRVDKDSNPYINEIREMRIESFEEGESLIQRAVVSRSVAATRVNQASSRGHLLVTIKVLKFDGVSSKPKISRLAVADLAGSENSTNSSAGLQLREATKINRGLFNLCRCISAISGGKNGKSEGIIPFRGCQLTTALRPYIQQAHLTFLLHVDPSNENQTRETRDVI
ncbi:P-loop containing nucleoside triphosphate hydrolase protein [Zopfochytrium polystomum]|nr:P-loop containing nucleoside triphosphate hydrolase protein [Zopfochytrium polystomum]